MCLVALILAFAAAPSIADWKQVEKQYSEDILGGNEHIVRIRAIKLSSEYKEIGATKLLYDALAESCAEHHSMERRFGDLSRELEEILLHGIDERTLPNKKKEQLEERRQIGLRILQEEEITALVVERLAGRKDEEAHSFLAAQLPRTRNWRTKTRLIESLGRMKNTSALDELHKASKDKDPRIRMYTVEALGAIGSPKSAAPLGQSLKDTQQQVRAYAIEALKEIKSPGSVPDLITALSKEEGLLRQELSIVLEEITGEGLGVDSAAWGRWWADNSSKFLAEGKKAKVAVRAAKDKTNPFSYYGIKTYSKKVIFILDISDSMNDSAEETVVPRSGIPKRTGNIRPKILVARDELTQAIVDLPDSATFNIVVYNKYVSAWKAKMMSASKRNKNDALAFVMGLKAKEATNISDALDLAFRFAGSALRDKYYPSEVDTIFFLTDGKATTGRIQATKEIRAEVKRINKIGKVKIHTIGVGYLHDRPFLEAMAKENGGSYVNVQ